MLDRGLQAAGLQDTGSGVTGTLEHETLHESWLPWPDQTIPHRVYFRIYDLQDLRVWGCMVSGKEGPNKTGQSFGPTAPESGSLSPLGSFALLN